MGNLTGNCGDHRLVVRPAREDEGSAVGTLFAAACRLAYDGILPERMLNIYEPARQGEAWTGRIGRLAPERAVHVALRDGSIVGFAHLGLAEESSEVGGPAGELFHLFVGPDSGRTGVGTALVRYARRWFADRGLPVAVLWVFSANTPARRFYEAVGWTHSGAERSEPELLRMGIDVLECRYEARLHRDGEVRS